MKKYLNESNGKTFYGLNDDERDRIEKYTKGITMLINIEKQLNPSFADRWNKNDEKGLTILTDHVIAEVNDITEGPQASTISKMLAKLPLHSEAWEHIEELGVLPSRAFVPDNPNVAEFFDLELEDDEFMSPDEARIHRRNRFARKERLQRANGPSPMRKR